MVRMYRKIRSLLNINNDIRGIKKELLEVKKKIDDILYDVEEDRSYLSRDYICLERLPQNNKEKILLCGYYGAQNGGDELMLRAILDNMPGDKDVTILLSQNYGLDSIEYYPYKTIHYPKKPEDCRYLAEHFDTIVWGGGAVIDDEANRFAGAGCSLTYAEMTVSKMMLEMGKKIIALGVSANKVIRDAKTINDLSAIINGASYFSVRDKNSLKTLSDAGIDVDKISLIDDLALANDYDDYGYQKGEVGIILITEDAEKTAKIIDSIVKALRGRQATLKLISFFNLYGYDRKRYEEIIKNVDVHGMNIEIIDTELNLSGISEVLSRCEMIISMRYHATLIGNFVYGRKMLCIDYGNMHRHYHNKNKYIKDCYVPDLATIDYEDASDEAKMRAAISRVWGQKTKRDGCRIQSIKKNTKEIIKQSLK